MSFVAVAIGGGALVSGGLGYLASTQASQAQVGEEQQGLALQQSAQAQAQANLAPYENVGAGATYSLGQLYGIGQNGQQTNAPTDFSQFTNSPDYAFAQQQGNQALQSYENANGLAGSGGALAAASQYNQGLATQQYGNYFNRLLSLSQVGQGAATAGSQIAVGGANAEAQSLGSIGQSQASGIVGGTNAVTSSLNSGINNTLLYNAINRTQGAQGGNPSSFAPIQLTGTGNIGGTAGNLPPII